MKRLWHKIRKNKVVEIEISREIVSMNHQEKQKERKNRRVYLKIISICLVLLLSLTGCGAAAPKTLSLSGFAFDTTYSITIYGGGNKKLLDSCVAKCTQYEKIFSRTRSDSELYQINKIEKLYLEVWQQQTGEEKIGQAWKTLSKSRLSKEDTAYYEKLLKEKIKGEKSINQKVIVLKNGALRISISKEMKKILQKGLEYGKLSQGGFDITICPVSSLWDFTSEEKSVPEQSFIEEAVTYVDYQKVSVTDAYVEFAMPGMSLDLGGIAKGYIADCLKQYLMDGGVTSGIISLGGNILCIGKKSEKDLFQIGIQQPFANRNETVAGIQAEDVSVVSSGVYERYFEVDENIYHHILNPQTGYSYDNDLIGVTIVSEKSVDGDGLSTTVFSMGLEKGMELIESLEQVEALFITEDEQLHYSEGFEVMLYEKK